MSVASAYRRDAAAGRTRESESEGAWLAVASLIEQAAAATDAAQKDLIKAAAHLVVKTLGASFIRAEARAEWGRAPEADAEILFLFAIAVEGARLLDLAESVTAAAARIAAFSPLDRARFAVLRARIARRLDRPDFAEDGYRAAFRIGTALGNAELKARAALGLMSIAQVSGNYPELLRRAKRAIAFAREAHAWRIEHDAHLGIVAVMAMRREFSRAIDAAWSMIECSQFDPSQEAKDLATLGQLLLEMNRPDAAVKVLTRIFRRPAPPEAFVAALGSLAIAAARSSNGRLLDWTIAQVDELRMAAVHRFQYTSTLLDTALALVIVGRNAAAREYRDAALKLAVRHKFNEFIMRAEALDLTAPEPAPSAAPVTKAGAHILRSIGRWQAKPLPRRARMAGPRAAR